MSPLDTDLFIIGRNNTSYNTSYLNLKTNFDSRYLQLSGDTMTGDLIIDRSTGSSDVETKLTLKGERSNTTNPAAAIKFENKNSTTVGYLTYKSHGSDSWFTFTQDLDLNSKGIHTAARLRLNSGGHIASGTSERIIVRTGSDTSAGTEIQRPGDNKRTFAIKGKPSGSGSITDFFWAYGNSGSGGDAINYTGLVTQNNHIVNKKWVDDNTAAKSHTHSGYASSSHTHSGYASSSHTHSGYASSSHNHNTDYVKGNYTITKSNGNYYIS